MFHLSSLHITSFPLAQISSSCNDESAENYIIDKVFIFNNLISHILVAIYVVVMETFKCVHIFSVTRVHCPGVMCVSNCLILSTQTASIINDESAEYGLTEKVQCVLNV